MIIVSASLRSRRIAVALGAVLLGGACVPAGRVLEGDRLISTAGTSMAPNIPRVVPTTYSEAHTVSFALDRIDQRVLPLDHTYKHYGTGQGVTVYVFDGGIMGTHPELAGRYRLGFDAFPNEDHICNAHGTAVAGAIAGSTLGVAPQAEIVDVKMVECRRMRGTIDAIVRGADWAIEDHAKHPRTRAVANWSFIADTLGSIAALDSAVQRLAAAGIPVVVSAGNIEMDACHISPGNSPGVITVGSSRVKLVGNEQNGVVVDQRTPGTAYGACISVFAPGDSVLLPSMDARHQPSEQLWTGTSMSAGYVSGAAALFLESHPAATTSEVARYIRATSSTEVVVDPMSLDAGLLYVGPGQVLVAANKGVKGQGSTK
jgi:subtilisin family serine protease